MSDAGQTRSASPGPGPGSGRKTYIVEHLDPELGPWSELEYACVARECAGAGSRFVLSSLPPGFRVPASLAAMEGGGHFAAERRGVEDMYPRAEQRRRVCLLDPQADRDLAPEDRDVFDVFLFGGILGELPLLLLCLQTACCLVLRWRGWEGKRGYLTDWLTDSMEP